jgi:TPP-dependent pyruvate/acetoin dehydrogenase alpha subunit
MIKESDTKVYREEARQEVKDALKEANSSKKPKIDELFNDVYDKVYPHL